MLLEQFMYFKKIAISLLFVFFANNVLAKSSVFLVSKGKNKVILAGTIHLLRPTDFPLPKEFNHAFQRSEVVFFETDIAMAASQEFSQRLADEMRLQPGISLDQLIKPELWSVLETYAQNSGFPLENMKIYNPAFVSMMMTVYESQRLGISGGVEAHFHKKLGKKLVGELEDQDEAIAAMKKLSLVNGNAIISYTLRDIKNFDGLMDTTVKFWRKGKTEKLYKSLALEMRKYTPEVYDSLLVERNQLWLPKIEALFNTSETELVLVGAMHLSGPDSLLKMLKDRGYKVRSYRAYTPRLRKRRSTRN